MWRQPLKDLKWYGLLIKHTTSLQIFKGRLPQISLASFLNALCYIHLFLFSTFKETWKLDDSDLQQAAEWIIRTLIKSFHFGFHFFYFCKSFFKTRLLTLLWEALIIFIRENFSHMYVM